MNKWRLKCKAWRDRHSKLPTTQAQKSSLRRKSIYTVYENGGKKIVIDVPKIFSFIKNPEDTMKFIENFKCVVDENEERTHIHVNSRFVKDVTVDALIYLLAAIDNSKEFKQHLYSGSFPKSKKPKRVYIDSGFTKYVQTYATQNDLIPNSTHKMRIERGMKNDTKVIKDICDFIRQSLNFKSIKATRGLYTMLVELLSNAVLHAYESESFLKGKWYIYAEHIGDHVRLVFADTGRGIPETVQKSFGEKANSIIRKLLFIENSQYDGHLIKSALLGEFRTSTKEKHRGNGLDTVRRIAMTDKIRGFEVISGHGKCSIVGTTANGSGKKEILVQGFAHEMYGTLYVFDVYGGMLYGENKDM